MTGPSRPRPALAGVLIAVAATPEQIRKAIAEELSEPKYRLGTPWWTRVLEWLREAWARFIEWALRVSEHFGGPIVAGLLVGGVLIVAAIVVTSNLGRRRARIIEERIRREHEAARGLDPAELERRAEAAERAGDHAVAFRLLFRAALIRLDRAALIDLRPGSTSGRLSGSLGSPRFDDLVGRFDAIVYGDKPATASDPALVRAVLGDLLHGARAATGGSP